MHLKNAFKDKKIIVTGHTGFKGSWLSFWLKILGAKVIGLSINIPSNPSHFKAIRLQNKIIHKNIDIRNLKLLKKNFQKISTRLCFSFSCSIVSKKILY